jgi:two-component system response regulator RegA
VDERPLLFIVEDDEPFRQRMARALEARGFDVRAAASIKEAQALLAHDPPEFVVLDLRMPDGNGLDLIPLLTDADPETRIVVLTGYGSIATAMEAVRRGATDYLTKPVDADDIVNAFARAGATPQDVTVPHTPMSLDRVEWEHISRVLLECQHNVSEAARVLGMHRRSLQRKLAKYPPVR